MLKNLLILLLCFLVTACAQLPTSERLENVRAEREQEIALTLAGHGYVYGAPVFVRGFKDEGVIELWIQRPEQKTFALYKSYPICMFSGDLGPKLAEGDEQAPEGFYRVGKGQMNPWSREHLSFNLGFPNEYDESLGRTGSNLMIHGGCASVGCYAMTDEAMEEIYLLVEAALREGQKTVPVHLFPFRLNARNMAYYQNHEWMPFWENLKQGYDIFELSHIPPNVDVRKWEYAFRK